jgi:hypothetical protein
MWHVTQDDAVRWLSAYTLWHCSTSIISNMCNCYTLYCILLFCLQALKALAGEGAVSSELNSSAQAEADATLQADFLRRTENMYM